MPSLIHKDLCCFQCETKTPIYETGYCENDIIEKMTFFKMTIQKMATINQTVF
jgi:hypothetical protein